MTLAEVYDEVRTLVGEPQLQTVGQPYVYQDGELLAHVRSAIRQLSAKKVDMDAVLGENVFTTEPGNTEGVLIALYVAIGLLRGDMIRKLNMGEMGVYFRSGFDIIDTTKASFVFRGAADKLEQDYRSLLIIMLSDQVDGPDTVFGESTGLV